MTVAASLGVVGGGVIGLACALTAARDGWQVSVYDDAPGRGASDVAGGMLAPFGEGHHGEEELLEVSVASAQMWPEFAASVGLDFAAQDTILAGVDSADAADLDTVAQWLAPCGYELEALSGKDIRDREPGVSRRVRRGYLVVGERAVDNRATVRALLQGCREVGVDFVERRVEQVSELPHDQVVVSAGIATPDLCDVSMFAGKGEILRLQWQPGALSPLKHVVRTRINGRPLYVIPRHDGVVVGATQYEAPRDDDGIPEAGGVADLLVDAFAVMPGLRDYRVVDVQAGLRPMTPDGLPLVGRLDDRTVVASGHGRNGVLLAPITAAVVGDALRGTPNPLARQLDPRRQKCPSH